MGEFLGGFAVGGWVGLFSGVILYHSVMELIVWVM